MRLAIDARERAGEVSAVTRVAGLPLVCRIVRQAARLGLDGCDVFVADEAGRADVAGALARFPPPAGYPVEIITGEPRGELVERASASGGPRAGSAGRGGGAGGDAQLIVPALAVYTADGLREGRPLVAVRSAGDVREAERRLTRVLRKSVDLDGVVAYYFMRPLSRLLTRALIDTPVTPNQVTLVAMAFGVAAAVVASSGGYTPGAVAGALFWLGATVDCVDGEMARLRVQGSKLGEWLDTLADDVSTLGLLIGLGLGIGGLWAELGVAGAVIGALTSAKLYTDLHRRGLPIDTAQYPWFFGKASEGMPGEKGVLGRLFYWVSFLFRRDAFVTLVTLLLFAGLRRAAMVILGGGATVFGGLLILHLIVTRFAARKARIEGAKRFQGFSRSDGSDQR